MIEVDPAQAGLAGFYMMSSLVGVLVAKEVIEPRHALLVAAMAAFAARGNGQEGAANLIEQTFEGACEIDVESEIAAIGGMIEKASLQ